MTAPAAIDLVGPDNDANPHRRLSRRRLGLKIFMLLCTLILSLGLGETTVRLVAPQPPSWLDIYRRHPDLATYAFQPNANRIVETGECRWTVLTDGQGFRVSSLKSSGGAVAVCLGDSFAFGHGVNYEQSFVALLQAEGAGRFSLVNAAVPGYGPIQYRQWLEHFIEQGAKPAWVLIATYVGNDFHDCVWKSDTTVIDGILGNRGDLRSFIKRHLHLYRLAARCYHRIAPKPTDAFAFREAMYVRKHWEEGVLKRARDRFDEEWLQIAALVERSSIPLFVALIPTRDAVEAARHSDAPRTVSPDRNPALPAEFAAETLKSLGIPFVDLTADLASRPAKDVFFEHDGHFTPLGHRIAADAIQRACTPARE